ncbi:mucin-5AC-like [Oratosquilla oratoria]|uniref:mucin-5AC-like n=1 Tax=Oratosquilla oratoria TaxID=337810 RepID=UPI003F76EBBA
MTLLAAIFVVMLSCDIVNGIDLFLASDEPFFFRNPDSEIPHVRHSRRAIDATDCFIPTTLWFIAEGTEIFTQCESFVCHNSKIVSKGRQTCCELDGIKIIDRQRRFIDCKENICVEGEWVESNENDPECCSFEDTPYKNGDTLAVGCGATECAEGRWIPSLYTQGYCRCGRVYMDPHMQTFDGDYFSWQLRCNHTIVQTVSLEDGSTHEPKTAVYSHFVDCGAIFREGPACVATSVFRDTPNSIFVFHKGVDNRVWHNGEEVNLEPSVMMKVAGSLVWMVPGGVRVQGTSSILVEYHARGSPSVSVWVPPALRGRVEGLLGNFDDIPDNDIQRGRHGPANSLPFFAGSWMAKEQPDPEECKNPDLTQADENLCEMISMKERRRLRDLCKVRLAEYFSDNPGTRRSQLESCIQDMCACRDEAECLEVIADEISNQRKQEDFALPGCVFNGEFFESNKTRDAGCEVYRCAGREWILAEKQPQRCCLSNTGRTRKNLSW